MVKNIFQSKCWCYWNWKKKLYLDLTANENSTDSTVPISFFIYRDSGLFQTSNRSIDTAVDNITLRETVASQIIGANVEGFVVKDLPAESAVVIQFRNTTSEVSVNSKNNYNLAISWKQKMQQRFKYLFHADMSFYIVKELFHMYTNEVWYGDKLQSKRQYPPSLAQESERGGGVERLVERENERDSSEHVNIVQRLVHNYGDRNVLMHIFRIPLIYYAAS